MNQFSDITFGEMWTKSFSDYFPDVETFLNKFHESPFNGCIKDESATILYYMLLGGYGESSYKSFNDYNNMLKTLSTAAVTSPSIQLPETTARLHIKTKSIFTVSNNILECHPKNLTNRFKSPPVTERGTKSKKMFHIQNMEQIAKNIKNKFLHGKPMKGHDNVNTLTERQYMY